MPDTPTPRAVLAQALHLAQERCSEYITFGPDPDSEEVRELERDYLAALAASAGPLSAERLIELKGYAERLTALQATVQGDPDRNRVGDIITDLLTSYTALAAECAGLREELERCVVEAGGDAATYRSAAETVRSSMCQRDALAHDLAALRTTVAEYQDAQAAYDANLFNEDGRNHQRYQRILAVQERLLARTPTPEGQG